MNSRPDFTTQILEMAKASGASLAGIASITTLKNSPSYEIYHKSPYYEGYEKLSGLWKPNRCLYWPWFIKRLNPSSIGGTMAQAEPEATAG